MKARYLIWIFSVVLLCIFPTSESFSQDPGVPDTVRFGEWSEYVIGPPYTGQATVAVVVFNDEPIQAFAIPIKWTGPMSIDTAYFAEGRPDVFDWQSIDIDTSFIINLVWFGASSSGDPMSPGTGPVAYMHFVVYDTGWVELDTANTVVLRLIFGDPNSTTWMPRVVPSQYHIVPSLPGDVNSDGQVDLGDILFLVSYLYKLGFTPEPIERGDVNGDCVVDLGDVLYLISYLYKGGSVPQSGCAFF